MRDIPYASTRSRCYAESLPAPRVARDGGSTVRPDEHAGHDHTERADNRRSGGRGAEAGPARPAPASRRDPAGNDLVPFGRLPGTHFGRLLILDEATDLRGAPLRPLLMLMADVDGPLDAYLERLVEVAGDGLDRLFGACDGYPSARPGSADRRAFLRAHLTKNDAVYVNTIGRTVEQIRQEAQLREAIQDFLDRSERELAGREPRAVRDAIRRFIAGQPSLAVGAAAGAEAEPARTAARDRPPAGRAARAAAVHAADPRGSPALRRAAAAARDAGARSAPEAGSRARRSASRSRGPRSPRTSSARSASSSPGRSGGSPAHRPPVRHELRDPPRLQPGRPGRRQDDPLRPLGVPRRPAAADLRQQLRRQPRELHGRLHRQGRLGAERRLQQRRWLPQDPLARPRRAPRRAGLQGLPAHATRSRPRSGTRPTRGSPRSTSRTTPASARDCTAG